MPPLVRCLPSEYPTNQTVWRTTFVACRCRVQSPSTNKTTSTTFDIMSLCEDRFSKSKGERRTNW